MNWRLVALFLAASSVLPVFGLDGTIVSDVDQTAARTIFGPGLSPIQADTARGTLQSVVGDSATIGGWTIKGAVWALVDSLPTNDPTQVPSGGVTFSSRLLELDAQWQVVPGTWMLDVGKQIIHPSSGFFKTPLNLISRGAAGNVPETTPAASPQWEEGWLGAKIVYVVGDWTFEDFFSPPMTWSDNVDQILHYLTLQQSSLQNQFRIDGHLGNTDLQLLALLTSDNQVHFQTGAGVEFNLGDSLTVRAEATLSDSLDRTYVVDAASLAVATQTLTWVPRLLIGTTWSVTNDLSLVTEYYYNGLGFLGSDYTSAVQYAKNRFAAGANSPDILGQFGSFSAGRNYAFVRLADNISNQVTGQGWAEVNLQDLSGMLGIGISAKYDHWALTGALAQTWGTDGSEAHALPYLWQVNAELQFFF